MSAQAENESICRELFGWELHGDEWWGAGQLQCYVGDTPTFEDWSSAGLVLAVFESMGFYMRFDVAEKWTVTMEYGNGYMTERACEATGPLAIRAAALAYIMTPRA